MKLTVEQSLKTTFFEIKIFQSHPLPPNPAPPPLFLPITDVGKKRNASDTAVKVCEETDRPQPTVRTYTQMEQVSPFLNFGTCNRRKKKKHHTTQTTHTTFQYQNLAGAPPYGAKNEPWECWESWPDRHEPADQGYQNSKTLIATKR